MEPIIKLIVTDLDQTLLRTNKSVSSYTLKVLDDCKTHGIKIAIATARSEKAAKKYIDLIEPDAVISNGGALVRYRDRTIYKCMLSVANSNGLIQECLLNPNVGELTVETEHNYYWNSEKIAESADYSHAVYNDFSEPLNSETYKITVEIYDYETALTLATKYKECSMLAFRGENWYRFAHKSATKMNAITKLAEYLNIDIKKVAAFGDDYSDIEMLKCCGYGVAVSNAIDEVLKSAKYITDTNDNDGVAKYLEKLLMQ